MMRTKLHNGIRERLASSTRFETGQTVPREETMMARQQLDAFTRAYIEAALWSTNDESDESGGEPLDKNYGVGDIAPETMELIKDDCADFQKRFDHLIVDDDSPAIQEWGSAALAGHHFWLTREGHGTGFWDGDWPKHGDELTEASETYGSFDLYVGDDGLIYGPPPDWYRGRHARRSPGGVAEALPRPHRVRGRYRKPPHTPTRGHFVMPKSVVRDFDSVRDLIEHAYKTEHPTHVLVTKKDVRIYYPAGLGKYDESRAWTKGGYWHQQAPGDRKHVSGLPRGAEPIDAYLARSGRRTAEAPRGRRHQVRDYVPVDHRGRPLSGPTKDYSEAKRQADQAGGFVKFTTDPPGRGVVSEAWGRTRWSDWMILDAIDKGQQVPPEVEPRAVKLAQLGFIDTTGTWRLTVKGRRVVDQRVPVAAESARRRLSKPGRSSVPVRTVSMRPKMTDQAVMDLAGKLAEEVGGNRPTLLSGGFRWSEANASARFTTYSPEYDQKVVCVVSVFDDGSTAISFFSDESLSGTATYENIVHFTYASANVPEMVKDINWVRTTVDGYAASWQQPDTEVDEPRRSSRRSTTRRRSTSRRRSTRR